MAESAVSAPPDISLSFADRDTVYRRNFRYFLLDFVLFTIAIQFIGYTTVIPDFVRKLTSSEIVIGFSSHMFQLGYYLPQLFVARSLTRVQNKKWWFIGPNIPVRFLILSYGGLIVLLGESRPTLILIGFFVAYGGAALGDGLVGVPWMDLLGSSLDNKRRARLFGWGNALVGVLMLILAPIAGYILGDSDLRILGLRLDLPDLGLAFPTQYGVLFALAGVVMVSTIPAGLFIRELPGGTPRKTAPPVGEYIGELGRVLRTDKPFRTMVIVRALVAFFMMAMPFYIGLATERLDLSSGTAVRNLLFMQTMGSVGGSLLYARIGDRQTTFTVRLALFLGIFQPLLALIAAGVGPGPLYVVFLLAGIVDSFVGVTFVNWVIMYTTPDQRPIYSGLFNTVSAVALFLSPIIGGLLVQAFDYEATFIVSLLTVIAALFVSLRYVHEPARAAA